MEKILANGLRVYSKDTRTSLSEVLLLIPAGENHEQYPECAHACEHFACAFNGGFSQEYGFLNLRNKYGINYSILTYDNYTIFKVLSIPKEAIREVCNFIAGIFNITRPSEKTMRKEIAIIQSELGGGDPIDRIFYSYVSWIRHNGGKPNASRMAENLTHLEPEMVYEFHSRYYRPSLSLMYITRPSSQAIVWDRELSQKLTSENSFIFPGRRNELALNNCMECSVIKDTWVIPSKTAWGAISVFFKGPPSTSEVLARGLVSSSTRLSGEKSFDTMSVTDYIRSHRGLSYTTRGKWLHIKDKYTEGTLAVIIFNLNKHLSREDIGNCMRIVTNKTGKLPARGDLTSMVTRDAVSRKSKELMFLLKMAKIPVMGELDWQKVYHAYKTFKSSDCIIGGVFSSPI